MRWPRFSCFTTCTPPSREPPWLCSNQRSSRSKFSRWMGERCVSGRAGTGRCGADRAATSARLTCGFRMAAHPPSLSGTSWPGLLIHWLWVRVPHGLRGRTPLGAADLRVRCPGRLRAGGVQPWQGACVSGGARSDYEPVLSPGFLDPFKGVTPFDDDRGPAARSRRGSRSGRDLTGPEPPPWNAESARGEMPSPLTAPSRAAP